MAKVQWKFGASIGITKRVFDYLWLQCGIIRLTVSSLFYNDFADRYYIGDTCLEPLFWIVDHFTKILGPVCVVGVILLSSSLIIITYVIGLPFYLHQHILVLTLALVIGHWILINLVFYYFMAYKTDPGYPPQGAMISEAVSICKKCIAPKPPRTHHCSVCNRCVLKMDHHCPWLNNCIGHFNHRYFFMFCVYAWIGAVFVMLFGIPVAYVHFFGNTMPLQNQSQLLGHNKSNLSDVVFKEQNTLNEKNSKNSTEIRNWPEAIRHSCIVYAALLCIAVFFVVGGLIAWHSSLISLGETSIEGHINKKERKRFSKEGKVYKNPYDFGSTENWKLFLGLHHRSMWHILIPFAQQPYGDGLQWDTLKNRSRIYASHKESHGFKSCTIKVS